MESQIKGVQKSMDQLQVTVLLRCLSLVIESQIKEYKKVWTNSRCLFY